jgi:hypothetical protein
MEPATALPADLRTDCARCQGLCCVSLAFDRSEWFALDKAAGEPCPHLLPSNRCRQHARLETTGYGGCASYDCYGAGQRVTEELFPGLAWRRAPEQRRALFTAFLRLRDVHELRLLLRQAARLSLPEATQMEGLRLLGRLEPAGGLTAERLAALEVEALHGAVHQYLRGLQPHVARVRPLRRRLALLP